MSAKYSIIVLMKKLFLAVIFLPLFVFIFSAPAHASLGVGVGTGKIQVDQKLYPGTIYTLPSLTVFNTGDEPSYYTVTIDYNDKQPELMPAKEWFIYSPEKFYLEPGKAQVVSVKLNLPVKMQPGDYFAYLEGTPTQKDAIGQATIGIAAAAKLYFTVNPANFFQGVYYKIITFWKVYQPWTNRAAMVAAAVIVLILIKKYLKIDINLKKSEFKKEEENKEKSE
jgi:hypothetical protein